MTKTIKKSFNLAYLANYLGADLHLHNGAESSLEIDGLASLEEAGPCKLAYCSSNKYLSQLKECKASVLLVSDDIFSKLDESEANYLVVAKVELAFASLTRLFSDYPEYEPGIHANAFVHEKAVLGKDVCICANAVIEADAEIGDACIVGPGSVVGEGARVGQRSRLFANVNIYHQVRIGDDCIIHAGSTIGSDGFGYVPGDSGMEKLYQLGSVEIGQCVEIGANCAIDRGALSDTRIADGVKIDNLVHIAHNVQIGMHTAIAGCVGIAGSAKIGAYCQFGGQVGVNGHIEICDGVVITGKGLVSKSIREAGVYSSGIPASPNIEWRRNIARFHNLNEMAKTVKQLEKKLAEMEDKK